MENSLVLQWLGLCAFTAKDPGSIPSWETKISQPAQCGQKKIFFFFITQIERAKEKSVLKKKKNPGRTTSLYKMAQTQFSLLLSTKCNYKPWK